MIFGSYKDLARLYKCANGIKTVNLAVKRHINRFPDEFMFQLTYDEFIIWRSQFDMNPISWTIEKRFYMRKLSYEENIEIYNKVKEKVSVTYLSKKYNLSRKNIYYMVRLIDKHGKEILKRKNQKYSLEFKEKAVKRVVENKEPAKCVAIDIGLSSDVRL